MSLAETIKLRLKEYEEYVMLCKELKEYPWPFEAVTKNEKVRIKALHFAYWQKLKEQQ